VKRTPRILGGLLALALVVPLAAGAAKPPSSDLAFSAKPTLVTFGKSTVLSGQLKGSDKAGKTVDIQEMPFGSTKFTTISTKTTDTSGSFSFTTVPKLKTTYRAVAKTSPPITSAGVLVKVAYRVSLKLGDSTPAKGQLVKFSGSVAPENDGAVVFIQRRTSTGSFRTVARTNLKDAGTSRSVFSRKIRVKSDGVYRARVLGTPKYETGTSATRKATVH
jgi:hypothetical protein